MENTNLLKKKVGDTFGNEMLNTLTDRQLVEGDQMIRTAKTVRLTGAKGK